MANKGGRGRVWIPPFLADIICEQQLMARSVKRGNWELLIPNRWILSCAGVTRITRIIIYIKKKSKALRRQGTKEMFLLDTFICVSLQS